MAQPGNLFDSYDAVGVKEDITDMIHNISPTETPAISSFGTTQATQRLHQWQTDTLRSPSGTNAHVEGDDDVLEADTDTATTLLGNYTQISKRIFGVSGSMETSETYGRDSELAYKAAKHSRELKTDVDMAVSGVNNASVVGTNAVARETGSLETWIASNASRGIGGTSGTQGATGTTAAGDGTLRPFTQSLLDEVIRLSWGNGAKPTIILAGSVQKTNISGFDGVGNATAATNTTRTDRSGGTIFATMDVYMSNFGTLTVVPSRHIRETANVDRNVFVIDPEYGKVAYFRPWQQYDLAKTGDNIRRTMLVEWALEICNPDAHGVVADLDNT